VIVPHRATVRTWLGAGQAWISRLGSQQAAAACRHWLQRAPLQYRR